jgi:hypothetical protein
VVDVEKLVSKYKDISYVLKKKELFESVKVGIGGYSVSFNETIEISTFDLRKFGVILPLTANDIYGFIRRNIVDATKACDRLKC